MEIWAVEKKSVVVLVSLPQSPNRFRVSWKQCLNLRSRKWLRPRRNLVRSLIPYGLWILKVVFAQCRIKFRRFFLKIERRSNFAIKIFPFRYNRREEWTLEIVASLWIAGILLLCLVSRTLFKFGIKWNRYDGDFSFNIL